MSQEMTPEIQKHMEALQADVNKEQATPEGMPAVPNIDELPSFAEITKQDPTVDVAGPTGLREDGPLSAAQKNALVVVPEDDTQEPEAPQPAISIHLVFMEDGQFGIQAQGEPNLGEMQMLLSRALSSIEARMVAETVTQVMKQNKSRIITPGRS